MTEDGLIVLVSQGGHLLASSDKGVGALWSLLDHFTGRRWATRAVVISLLLVAAGFVVSLNLKIGDLDPGAPELRPDSRYNKDNAFITDNYALSSDQFAVILKTEQEGCMRYEALIEADLLAWALRQVPWVQTTVFIPLLVDLHARGLFPFDRMIRFYPFDQINAAIADSESGRAIKPIVRMGQV